MTAQLLSTHTTVSQSVSQLPAVLAISLAAISLTSRGLFCNLNEWRVCEAQSGGNSAPAARHTDTDTDDSGGRRQMAADIDKTHPHTKHITSLHYVDNTSHIVTLTLTLPTHQHYHLAVCQHH